MPAGNQRPSFGGPHGERRLVIAPRTIWPAAAVAAGIAITWLVVAETSDVLVLLFIAIVLTEGLRPPVEWLQPLPRRRRPAVLSDSAQSVAFRGTFRAQ